HIRSSGNFQKASRELTPAKGKSLHDEFRCELAASEVKSGRALLALGKPTESEKSFLTAMETLLPSPDMKWPANIPMQAGFSEAVRSPAVKLVIGLIWSYIMPLGLSRYPFTEI